MVKGYDGKFKDKRAVRKHIARRITFWDSAVRSESDRKKRELCLGYKNYWERKLRELR